ncbi:hypothetical protein TRVL_06039 [Trypanosoma vivax]|nr:hypothetical protein TRVL_06039 [Trypanosoma vivax]
MGRNPLFLVQGIFISVACGAFVGQAVWILVNAWSSRCLRPCRLLNIITCDFSGRDAHFDLTMLHFAESLIDSFNILSFHRPSTVSVSTFHRKRISTSHLLSFLLC